MALTAAQATDVASKLAGHLFNGIPVQLIGSAVATINADLGSLTTNVQAVDGELDTTLNAAVTAGFGADTFLTALEAKLAPPVSGWTNQQKLMLLAAIILKRAAII